MGAKKRKETVRKGGLGEVVEDCRVIGLHKERTKRGNRDGKIWENAAIDIHLQSQTKKGGNEEKKKKRDTFRWEKKTQGNACVQ